MIKIYTLFIYFIIKVLKSSYAKDTGPEAMTGKKKWVARKKYLKFHNRHRTKYKFRPVKVDGLTPSLLNVKQHCYSD